MGCKNLIMRCAMECECNNCCPGDCECERCSKRWLCSRLCVCNLHCVKECECGVCCVIECTCIRCSNLRCHSYCSCDGHRHCLYLCPVKGCIPCSTVKCMCENCYLNQDDKRKKNKSTKKGCSDGNSCLFHCKCGKCCVVECTCKECHRNNGICASMCTCGHHCSLKCRCGNCCVLSCKCVDCRLLGHLCFSKCTCGVHCISDCQCGRCCVTKCKCDTCYKYPLNAFGCNCKDCAYYNDRQVGTDNRANYRSPNPAIRKNTAYTYENICPRAVSSYGHTY